MLCQVILLASPVSEKVCVMFYLNNKDHSIQNKITNLGNGIDSISAQY